MSKLAGLAVLGAMWLTPAANAQQPSVDPQAGSPAGRVYELPLDSARKDAAPKRPSQTRRPSKSTPKAGGGSDGSGAATSAIRSENGFGSSDSVPGADDAATGSRGKSGGGGGEGVAGGNEHAQVPKPALDRAAAGGTEQAEDSSSVGVYLLLGLVLLVAVALGLATRGRRGGGTGGGAAA